MKFEIVYTKLFEKEFKRLAAKYPSLKSDFKFFLASLYENPLQGDPLGNNCYKVRMSIASKRKGKSGGARVITCVKVVKAVIFLVSIYDKSERTTISNQEILERLRPYLQ